MRYSQRGVTTAGLAILLLAGCNSDTSTRGFSSVTVTDEERQGVAGNLCAIKGHATNTGNTRARVRIAYEAKDAQGATIGTADADFQVAGFSNFDFSNSVLNNQGQPSSSVFTNNLSCASIDHFRRTNLDVEAT